MRFITMIPWVYSADEMENDALETQNKMIGEGFDFIFVRFNSYYG